jgi:hypothetical protein
MLLPGNIAQGFDNMTPTWASASRSMLLPGDMAQGFDNMTPTWASKHQVGALTIKC